MSANFLLGKWLSTPETGEEVVISGMAGRLPESENIAQFKEHLLKKEDMITGTSEGVTRQSGRCGRIANLDRFDSGFFGLHCRQSKYMDSMIRILLETAIESIIDAGINPKELEGSRTGVFIAYSGADSECKTSFDMMKPHNFGLTGAIRCFSAHRLSYFLKLKGPSYSLDSACSSSLNALEHAFRSIRHGECDNAIFGCMNLTALATTMSFYETGALAADGIMKVFDEKASGFVRSNAVGCLFLQKSRKARRIYGTIIHAKTNDDGYKIDGITYPSTQAQSLLLEEVYQESGLDVNELCYLEAHGTGTKVGDPIEVEAIDKAIGRKRKNSLRIGSVKSNMGHAEYASGFCSVCKVLLALETGAIPANLHLHKPRSDIEAFSANRLQVVTETTTLTEDNALIGVSNFGFGGNNAHAILRRYPKKKPIIREKSVLLERIVCVSGRTEEAVQILIQDIKKNGEDLEYVALLHHAFSRNMYDHPYKGYVVLPEKDSILESIKLCNAYDRTSVDVVFGDFDECYKNVGRSFCDFPIFHSTLNKLNHFHMPKLDILELVNAELSNNTNDTIAGLCVQIAFVEIYKALGLKIKNYFGITPIGQLAADYFNDKAPVESIFNILSRAHTIRKFESCVENAYKRSKNTMILSNHNRIWNALNVRLAFLELIGSLYQQGHEIQLFNLYPKIDFPVSRSTPMISPSILWDHSKQWQTHMNDSSTDIKKEERRFNLNCKLEEDRYLLGHVVDGRNLFPATGYLYLVWDTLAQINDIATKDMAVIFENCRFVRAVNIPPDEELQLSVTIQRGSGLFEVIHKNFAVVTGKISTNPNPELRMSQETSFFSDGTNLTLIQEEIYRELTVRGYSYSGLFRAIEQCNLDASKGVIRWDNNWVTFLDNMLQLQALVQDTRFLYVPVFMERLSIDPVAHSQMIEELSEEGLVPVTCCKATRSVKSGAIEIKGLVPSSITRRKNPNQPVLEKHMFVPNVTDLELKVGLRVVIQMILENSQVCVFNAVEKFEDEPEPLLPVISQILQDIPLIKPDLTISTNKSFEPINGVKVESVVLTEDSKIFLLIGSNISNNPLLIACVKREGFIVSREDYNFDTSTFHQPNLVLLNAITTENEKLVLLRRDTEILGTVTTVKVTSENFNWIPELQKGINDGLRVVVYSQNESLSGILGLMNCLRREKNGSNLQCFFITDETAPKFDLYLPFYREQMKKKYAFNIYKDRTWGTYRHLVLDDYIQQNREHAFVSILDRGNLTSLTWLEGPLRSEENNLRKDKTIIVTPYYCSLNFRDIVAASGRINLDAYISSRIEQECLLGSEFAGRTADGQRVMGFGTGGWLASLIKADSNSLLNVPQNWSLEDAATTITVYSTVIYGLILRNNCLQSGKSILIHCGAGGIGMAAINMALHYKMNVFTTVGTKEKRDFIMKQYPQLKDWQVGNSRDTSFVSMVKRATNGRGVDVVLNSLSEEKLIASIHCLANGGSFMEIGKFDLLRNTLLHLLPLDKEASFHGVMVDHHVSSDNKVVTDLIGYVDRAIRSGLVKPLPRTVFPENKIEDAFRYMSSGKHVGKVLVRLRDEEPQEVSVPNRKLYKAYPRFFCNSDKVQIIIGGLGGMGLELSDWLMLRNAGTLLISTRNGITSSYQQQKINMWGSYGVNVVVSKSDVTTRSGCEELIREGHNLGTIEGIFNLAVVLKDAAFENQSKESFDITFGPKAHAVQYLDEITRQSCPDLRYFVVFSSVVCGRGNPGQTNYAMANSIMERICEKRKEEGFPALAIQWGAIGDVGLVAKMHNQLKVLEISGTLQQRISNCISLLDRFMNQDHPIVSSMIVAEKKRKLGSNGAADAVAHILGVKDLNSVVSTTPLAELGMDSLTSSEINQVLEKEFEIYVNPEDMKNLTFEKLRHFEASRASVDNDRGQKTTLAMAKFFKFLPDPETGHLPIIEMPSNNNNSNEKEPLLFVLPGIEGLLSDLEVITKYIEAKVIGLQYCYKIPVKTLSDVANRLLPHIEKKLGNSRTFYVMAYSFGVLVALEIAHSLESKGYQGIIFAIDGSPDYCTGFVKQFTSSENEDAIQISVLLQVLKQILPIAVVDANKDKIINAKCKRERFEIAAQLIKQGEDTPNYEFETMVLEAEFSRYYATGIYDYSHGNKLRSFVKLYSVSHPMIKDMDEDYGLSRIMENEVEVVEFDADHISVLNEVSIADDINKVLTKYCKKSKI